MSFNEIQFRNKLLRIQELLQQLSISISEAEHDHDDRYYTESEVDGYLEDKSDDPHIHDDRYYTESEVTTALAGKANASHNHVEADISDLDHDADKVKGIEVDNSDIADGKILQYNSVTTKLEYEALAPCLLGMGKYQAYGNYQNTLTCDGNWKDLDLSSYISHDHPKFGLFNLTYAHATTGNAAYMRPYNSSGTYSCRCSVVVANKFNDNSFWLPLDDNKKVSYKGSSGGSGYLHFIGYIYGDE